MPEETPGQPANDGANAQEPKDGDGGATPKTPPAQFVTPEILTGVLGRHTRSTEESLKKQMEAATKNFEALLSAKLEELKAAPPTKGDGGKGGHGDNAAAMLELEKKTKDLEARLQATELARQQAETEKRDYKFQTKVEAALVKNKCTNPAVAYLAIKNYLTYDPQIEKITAKVKDTQFGLGDVDVDMDVFIKGTFAEEILPELFLGRVRPGAPAGGDNGSGGGANRVFKTSDIANMTPEEYARNRDRIDEAQKTGRVLIDT